MKKSYLYLVTTFMLWGSLYVVSQFVLGKIPTFTVAMFRYLIAFMALSLISLKSEKEKIEKSDYKYFFIMGFIGYFISVDCQLLGTKIAGGSMASLINSLNPIIISVSSFITARCARVIPSSISILKTRIIRWSECLCTPSIPLIMAAEWKDFAAAYPRSRFCLPASNF